MQVNFLSKVTAYFIWRGNLKRKVAIVFVGILCLSIFSAFELRVNAQQSSDDWPMFLHDTAHTGVTTNTGPEQPIKLWSYVEGHFDGSQIGSSAAVVNGIVYVGSNYNPVEQRGGNVYVRLTLQQAPRFGTTQRASNLYTRLATK